MLKILKLACTLAVVCTISAGLLAYVYALTAPRIEANAKSAFEKSLREVLPEADAFTEASGKVGQSGVYEASAGGKVIGAALAVSPRGYSGSIDLLVGVGTDLTVRGVKVLNQRETPGLGTNILKPAFLRQFVGKRIGDALEPKKDVDAITGATISTRGVCDGVRAALKHGREALRKEGK